MRILLQQTYFKIFLNSLIKYYLIVKSRLNRQFMKITVLLFCFTLIFGCSSTSDSHNLNDNVEDGTYCAKVRIKTREKTKTYQLTITAKNNHLQEVNWPNGGWLDRSHYKLPEFYENETTFIDDRDRKFDVKIIHKGKCRS